MATTLTSAQAADLIYRSMLTGVPTSEFTKAGGYDAVRAAAVAGGYDVGKPPAEKIREMGPQIAAQGSGNKSYAPGAAVDDMALLDQGYLNYYDQATGKKGDPAAVQAQKDDFTARLAAAEGGGSAQSRASTVSGLTQAQQLYYNDLTARGQDPATTKDYVSRLSDLQALASLSATADPRDPRAFANGDTQYDQAKYLTEKYGVTGPITVGRDTILDLSKGRPNYEAGETGQVRTTGGSTAGSNNLVTGGSNLVTSGNSVVNRDTATTGGSLATGGGSAVAGGGLIWGADTFNSPLAMTPTRTPTDGSGLITANMLTTPKAPTIKLPGGTATAETAPTNTWNFGPDQTPGGSQIKSGIVTWTNPGTGQRVTYPAGAPSPGPGWVMG